MLAINLLLCVSKYGAKVQDNKKNLGRLVHTIMYPRSNTSTPLCCMIRDRVVGPIRREPSGAVRSSYCVAFSKPWQ